VNWVQQVATTIMSDGDRSQDEIAANAIISMSNDALGNESRGNSTDGHLVPATQATTGMPVSNATTTTFDRNELKKQQELLTQFLKPPARRSQQQRSPSVKKLRKTDKTILTKTHEKKLLAEFAKAKSMERKMNWDALSKLSVFQNNFTPDILRNRGQALLKAHLEEEAHKKRVEATKLSVLKTFIHTTNDYAKMQEIVDELQADVDRLQIGAQAMQSQSCDSENIAADATAQLVKLQQELAKAQDDAKLTKSRQQDLENEIARSKVALESAEKEKLQLERDLESKVELEELKKRLQELYKEREVQEVEAAKLAREKKVHTEWISGLSRHVEVQSAIATKSNEDNNRLKKRLAETEAELEKTKKQLNSTKDTMKWLTSVEKAVKSTALHIDGCMGLNHQKGYNSKSGKQCT
jgi:hypothetical protein